jgi:ABC-type transport system involved in multi-copper enzyme maturation permease subunit
VSDTFYFVRQPLTGDGSITVRMTSLTGRYSSHGSAGPGLGAAGLAESGTQPWSKAGIIVKADTSPGSAYAAMLVTGDNGVRMQANYTQDLAGLAGPVSPTSPRWLRLTRSGDIVTGYDSTDGVTWREVGIATLAGLSSTVPAGLFATSPGYQAIAQKSLASATVTGGPSVATGTMDHLARTGDWQGDTWTGATLGASQEPTATSYGQFSQDGGTFRVTGSGDIAPDVANSGPGLALVGAFAGLIAVVVVATLFVTGEYRRGLIRTTLTASPRRGRVLAAKAIVIGVVTFLVGLIAAGLAFTLGMNRLNSSMPIDPVSTLAEVRIVLGTAGLFAVAAVLAMAIGVLVRNSATAVTAVIVAILLPYLLGVSGALPDAASNWLLRVTPAAAFAVQQAYPQYPQVLSDYSPGGGYFPLPPLAGFAVLCGYAVIAIGLAAVALNRRDA